MKNLLILIITLVLVSCNNMSTEKQTGTGNVIPFDTEGKAVKVFTTADSTDYRLTQTETLGFTDLESTSERNVYVYADPSVTFQNFIGIGGALTDAAAETLAKLPSDKQEELIRAYYDVENGIGYTLARTNINSCDFSSGSYTYIDEGDKELETFSIDHDKQYKIPLIKRVLDATGGKLTLFASPWSPPAFMKDNNNMLRGGKLLPEYYQSWATYFTKFIKSYEEEGIPVWGITIQNEPMATQTWESCIYFAEDERDFLRDYLGPTMKNEGLSDVKIIVWDHNRDLMVQRALAIFNDPEASKYAWGMGFHWYEDWTGGQQMYNNLGLVNDAWPDKHLIFTEGCNGPFNSERYYSWQLGEKYGISMINDFNNGTEGWTDWNILLDETGGPNHVGNFCFAPIHGDTRTGELIYTNSYYYIGHFSKFIRPGAKRFMCVSTRSFVLTTGFINEDGSVAIVVMNPTGSELTYNLCFGLKTAKLTLLPHSIQTLVI